MNINNNDRFDKFKNRVQAGKKIVAIELSGGTVKEFKEAKDTFRKGG